MSELIAISKARARVSELVRHSRDDGVVPMSHATPVAVIVSADRCEAMLEEIGDLKDRLSVHEREGVTVPVDKLAAELGLNL